MTVDISSLETILNDIKNSGLDIDFTNITSVLDQILANTFDSTNLEIIVNEINTSLAYYVENTPYLTIVNNKIKINGFSTLPKIRVIT